MAIHFYHGYKARVRSQAVTYLARYNNSSNPINSEIDDIVHVMQEVETFYNTSYICQSVENRNAELC